MDYQFYPTPADIAERLVKLLENPQPPILEPSAGTGDLIQAMCEKYKGRRWSEPRFAENDFHCVELEPTRAAALKGNGLNVVWDDFLTFNPLMPYRTIIMNPPFNEGAKHLHHALNILADGGELVCILNAETIRNPYTNERKVLLQELERQEVYTVEFVQKAFDDTDVEVALIHVKKKAAQVRCATFEHFKKTIIAEREEQDQTALTRQGEINLLIDLYRAEVKAALQLYDEYQNFIALTGKDSADKVFEIKVNSHGQGHAGIVKKINYNYWFRLLHSKELNRLLTSDAQGDYASRLRDMEEYEFNERNILQLKADLTAALFDNIEAAIMKVWENFTTRFHWRDEHSPNIHYYNGWKSNNAFKCNRRVVIPLNAFNQWRWHGAKSELDIIRVKDQLADIEKAMNYLDSGRTEEVDLIDRLQKAQAQGENRGIDTKFFKIDLYKKGTAHFTFKDEDLLKKFNIYCGKRLNWLPDDYGSKPYDSLDDDERAVADSFEGRDSYEDTFHNRQFYLPSNFNPLLLSAG